MTTKNSIGLFETGVSQIGTELSFDFNTTIISQYANSPILYQLIENINSNLDQTEAIDNFFDTVFDVETAQGFGLDILGRIVGIGRVLPVSSVNYLGFEEVGNLNAGRFGTDPFYNGQVLTSNYALSDTAFRFLILAKALANISNSSVASINKLLLLLFPNRGVCYVQDNENMTMTYKFNFSLSPVEQSIVVNSGVLPRPSGVAVNYSY